MQQFRLEDTKYLVPDGILHRRGKTKEPPAKVAVSAEQSRTAIEAAHRLSGHGASEGT